MARKSKRETLNEAIRQGQARIAEGLKTGQMRSDGPSSHLVEDAKDAKKLGSGVTSGLNSSFFSTKKTRSVAFAATRAKLTVFIWLVLIIIGIWLIVAMVGSDAPETGVSPQSGQEVADTQSPVESVQSREETVALAPDNKDNSSQVLTVDIPKGDNVICIESISLERKDELVPLKTFFSSKGIPTEITRDARSDRAILVTVAGFERNPAAAGTEGYDLLQRIKRLGTVFVQETNDTKFGLDPFQDAYGYKRSN